MTGSFADEAPDGKPHFSLCCPPQLKDPNLNLSDFKVNFPEICINFQFIFPS